MATTEPRDLELVDDDVIYAGEDASLYTGDLQLLGTWEVSRYLGIERSRIARWLAENDEGKSAIAPPVARLKSGPFWTFPQIHAKARQMYLAENRPVTVAPAATDAQVEEWLQARRAKRLGR